MVIFEMEQLCQNLTIIWILLLHLLTIKRPSYYPKLLNQHNPGILFTWNKHRTTTCLPFRELSKVFLIICVKDDLFEVTVPSYWLIDISHSCQGPPGYLSPVLLWRVQTFFLELRVWIASVCSQLTAVLNLKSVSELEYAKLSSDHLCFKKPNLAPPTLSTNMIC